MSNSAESSLQQWAILLEKEEEKNTPPLKRKKKYNTSDSQPLICSLVISKVHDAFFSDRENILTAARNKEALIDFCLPLQEGY